MAVRRPHSKRYKSGCQNVVVDVVVVSSYNIYYQQNQGVVQPSSIISLV